MMNFLKRHRGIFIRLIDCFIVIAVYAFVELFKAETLAIFTSSDRGIITNTIILAIVVYQIFLTLFDCYKNIIRYESG